MKTGVPQGSILATLLYSVYTMDISLTPTLFTFADDKEIPSRLYLLQKAPKRSPDLILRRVLRSHLRFAA